MVYSICGQLKLVHYLVIIHHVMGSSEVKQSQGPRPRPRHNGLGSDSGTHHSHIRPLEQQREISRSKRSGFETKCVSVLDILRFSQDSMISRYRLGMYVCICMYVCSMYQRQVFRFSIPETMNWCMQVLLTTTNNCLYQAILYLKLFLAIKI